MVNLLSNENCIGFVYMRFGATIPSNSSAFSIVDLNDETRHNLTLINSGVSAFKTLMCS